MISCIVVASRKLKYSFQYVLLASKTATAPEVKPDLKRVLKRKERDCADQCIAASHSGHWIQARLW